MIIVVAPGQGSQTPGFLAPWLELPGTAELLGSLSEAAGVDLVTHGTVSDADTIRDTAIAQPLIVAAGILTLDGVTNGAVYALLGLATVLVFAVTVILIHCYYGFHASGGPAGVGVAVGRAVRAAIVTIAVLDFFLSLAIWGTTTTVRVAG